MKKRDQTTMNWRRKSGHDDIRFVQGGVATDNWQWRFYQWLSSLHWHKHTTLIHRMRSFSFFFDFHVNERKVSSTAVDCCGHWNIRPCPPPLICTSHAPGIFSAIITEFAGGEVISSVPVITKVGFVMLESLLQVPLHLLVASI